VGGFKTRHNLALVYRDQGRAAEAEAQWRVVLAERPDFAAGWLGLGEPYLAQQRWPDLDAVLGRLQGLPRAEAAAAALRARARRPGPRGG
jgi:hypothetical protein